MTSEQIRTLFRARPFQPFILHLADGCEISVPHHEFMVMSPAGRTMIVYNPDESFNIVDLLLITDVEVKGNGSRRRKR